MKIKKIIKSDVFLYKSWLYVQRKGRGHLLKLRLPKNGDDFYIDGYPRSGNTFSIAFLNWLIPSMKGAHHLHIIAPLKIALKKNIPITVLYRHPKDAVSSFAIMQDYYGKGRMENTKFLQGLLNEYIAYYEFVLGNKDQIRFLSFTTITDVMKLNNFFNKNNELREVSEAELLGFEKEFKDKQKSKPKERTSMPNEDRENLKKKIEKSVQDLPNYSQAIGLFNNMISLNN